MADQKKECEEHLADAIYAMANDISMSHERWHACKVHGDKVACQDLNDLYSKIQLEETRRRLRDAIHRCLV